MTANRFRIAASLEVSVPHEVYGPINPLRSVRLSS
jgi:hypothetical protein